MLKTWFRNKALLTILLLGLITRLILIYQPAHSYDIGTFMAWGNNIIKLGPSIFFKEIWTDYLPLPLYLLGATSKLSNILGIDFPTLFKYLTSILEVFLIFWIYHLTKSTRVTTLLLLSPALIINSSLWGQIDSIVALLIAISLLLLYKNKITQSAIVFGCVVALKSIAIIILPVLLFITFNNKSTLKFSLISFMVFIFTAIPFVYPSSNLLNLLPNSFIFLFKQASYQSSVYPFTTINAFNYWAIGGNNWITDQSSVLGITPRLFGLFIFLTLLFPALYKLASKLSFKQVFSTAAFILIIFYTFTTRMHERHLIYGLPLLLLASIKEKKYEKYYLILTVLYSINLYSAYFWLFNNQKWPISLNIIQALSLTLLIVVLLLIKLNLSINLNKIKVYATKNTQILIILFLALILRLANLSHPESMIFDEVYHAFTAREMLHNNIKAWEWWNTPPEGYAYEWTHPPLAKYGMVLGMTLFGENSFGWRFGSAIMGVITIWLAYELSLHWTKSKKAAITTSFLLSIEGLHLVQSRIAMNDQYMVAAMLASLLLASKSHWKSSAILFGLALSSKWSSLYTLIPLALLYIKENKLKFRSIIFAIRLLLISAIIYILLYTPFFISGHDYSQFIELQKQMWYYHTQLEATHAYQSQPLQWIISARPVWYYVDYKENSISNIYANSNPIILLLGLVAIITSLVNKTKKLNVALISYFSFTLPWIISPRIMFMYHYLPSIIFLSIILGYWVSKQKSNIRNTIIALSIAVFILLSPMYYGYDMSKDYWNILFKLFPYWK